MISNHPNDTFGYLTRAEVWGRVSVAIMLGVSLAVAKTNVGLKKSERR